MAHHPTLSPDNLEGITLKQHFHIQQKVSHGGMAWVYKALTTQQQPVALKVLFSHIAQNPTLHQRLLREAQVQAQLQHPNIVRVIDTIEEHNLIGLVMEWVEGPTLQSLLSPPLSPLSQTLALFLPIVDAIGHAHQQGIVHRDLKPSNILLHQDHHTTTPKVTDFGIAKLLQHNGTALTESNNIVGTIQYMAPEQSKASKYVDGRADIYSLGTILYHLTTGHLPFQANTLHAWIVQQQHATPAPPQNTVPDFPPDLAQVILTCLQKDPNLRYQNCQQLHDALLHTNLASPSQHQNLTLPISQQATQSLPTPVRARQDTDPSFLPTPAKTRQDTDPSPLLSPAQAPQKTSSLLPTPAKTRQDTDPSPLPTPQTDTPFPTLSDLHDVTVRRPHPLQPSGTPPPTTPPPSQAPHSTTAPKAPDQHSQSHSTPDTSKTPSSPNLWIALLFFFVIIVSSSAYLLLRGFAPDATNACQEGSQKACYPGPPNTAKLGQCKPGIQRCQEGRFGPCEGAVLPTPEACNDKDDDCDGAIDEDFPQKDQPCLRKAHACRWSGVYACHPDQRKLICRTSPTPKRRRVRLTLQPANLPITLFVLPQGQTKPTHYKLQGAFCFEIHKPARIKLVAPQLESCSLSLPHKDQLLKLHMKPKSDLFNAPQYCHNP